LITDVVVVHVDECESDDEDDTVLELDEEREDFVEDVIEESNDEERARAVVLELLKIKKTTINQSISDFSTTKKVEENIRNTYVTDLVSSTLLLLKFFLNCCESDR